MICEECLNGEVLGNATRLGQPVMQSINLECMKLFIKLGVNAETLANALLEAPWGHPECMKLLLECGAGMNVKILADVLKEAAGSRGNLECMKLLLEWGAGVNAGVLAYALKEAAYEGNLKCMKLLLEWDVSAKVLTKEALADALGPAATGGHFECMKLLAEWGGLTKKVLNKILTKEYLANIFWQTAAGYHLECMKLLLEWGATIPNSPYEFEHAPVLLLVCVKSPKSSAFPSEFIEI